MPTDDNTQGQNQVPGTVPSAGTTAPAPVDQNPAPVDQNPVSPVAETPTSTPVAETPTTVPGTEPKPEEQPVVPGSVPGNQSAV